LIEDDVPDMEWDSAGRRWVSVYPDDQSDENALGQSAFSEELDDQKS
jgi:hypothetical protein